MRREIDSLVNKKLDQISVEYDPADWAQAREMLGHDKKERPFGFLLIIPLLALLSIGTFYWQQYNSIDSEVATTNEPLFSTAEADNAEVTINEVDISTMQKEKFNSIPTHNSIAYFWNDASKDQFSPFPRYKSKTSDTDADIVENLSFNKINTLNFINKINQEQIDNWNQLDFIPKSNTLVKSAAQSGKAFRMSLGLSAETLFGGMTGIALDLSYPLSSKIRVGVRPSILLQWNSNNPAYTYYKQAYSFGMETIEGTASYNQSFWVDMPIYLSYQLGRSRMLIQGGAIHQIYQRMTMNEVMTKMDVDPVTNDLNELKMEDSYTVVMATEANWNPYIALEYQYDLSDRWALGVFGRSIFIKNENEHISKHTTRLSAGIRLNWKIN